MLSGFSRFFIYAEVLYMKLETALTKVGSIDLKIIVSVGLCILTSTVLNALGWKIHYDNMELDIIQKATAAIACLLVTQDNLETSRGAGWMRIKVTTMAAATALIVVTVDTLIGNHWASIGLTMVGVFITMLLCKLIKAPYMNCRIGAISYVLIAVTLSGQARIVYAIIRVLSTFYGVSVVLFVTWLFKFFTIDKG